MDKPSKHQALTVAETLIQNISLHEKNKEKQAYLRQCAKLIHRMKIRHEKEVKKMHET